MTAFESREERDTALIEELMQKADSVHQEIGNERLQREEDGDYVIYRLRRPDGTLLANKQHHLPQHLRGEE